MTARNSKRRLPIFILGGCIGALCLFMGTQAYYEAHPQSEPAIMPKKATVSLVRESKAALGFVAAQKGEEVAITLPEVPNPKNPPTLPIDPAPKPAPEPISDPVPVVEVEEENRSTRTHVVAKGDTLSSISIKHYGVSNRWQEIYEANKEAIPNKNNIKIGTVLTIPE
jgi:nucleoid-associated protein YgaU